MLKSSAFAAASLAAAANAAIEPEHPYAAYKAYMTGFYFAMSEYDDIQEIQRCLDWTYEEFSQVEEALEYAQSDEPWTAFFILMGVQSDVKNYTQSCNLELVHQQARPMEDYIMDQNYIRIIFNTGKYEKEIEQAAEETQQLLEEGHYFQAGLQVATIFQMSLGYDNVHDMSEPVFPHEVEAATGVVTADSYLNMVDRQQLATYLGELFAASLAETIYLNRLSGIGDCAYATTDFIQAVEQIYQDFTDDKQFRVVPDVIAASKIFKSNLELCKAKGAPEDVTSLIAWIDRTMTSRQKLVDAASANTLIHAEEVQRHVQEVWDVFFKMDQPVASGQAISRVAYWALGPVDPTASPM